MNPNVLWGAISFVVWSIFSVWFYTIDAASDEADKRLLSDQNVAIVDSIANLPDTLIVETKAPEVVPVRIEKQFHFGLDSSTPLQRQAIEEFLGTLNSLENRQNLRVEIVGHTCDLGSKAYNDQLGKRRAGYIQEALVTNGLFDISQIQCISQGEQSPLVANSSEANRSQNRRVNIIITSVS